VHHDTGALLVKLDEYFKMKEVSIQAPAFYLGAKLKKNVLPNGVTSWGLSSSNYAQSAAQNVQEYLAAFPGDQKFQKKVYVPFAGGYKPALDESPDLCPIRENFYSHRLESCAGVWSWDALTSSLKCQCCLLNFVCRVKVTWKLSYMCVHNWLCITT
jgi:hypothetical protein